MAHIRLSATAEGSDEIIALECAGHAFMGWSDEDALHDSVIPTDTGERTSADVDCIAEVTISPNIGDYIPILTSRTRSSP